MLWDFSVIWANAGAFLVAFSVTIYLSATSIFFGTLLGVLLGVSVLSRRHSVRWSAKALVEVFLALPVLVVIIWIYYALPLFSTHLTVTGGTAAILGLTLSLSAFVAEIVRAGIGSVPRGDVEAAFCLGLTKYQSLRYIVLPQALKRMWPPLMGQYITCYKMSTLASVVAVQELLHAGSTIIAQTYRPIEIYTAIAIIFLVTVIPMNHFTRRLHDAETFHGTSQL